MKKNLLAVGVLMLSFPLVAQNVLTYVGNGATVIVQNDALVYNGGGWQNVGTVANTGDIMVNGAATDKFEVAAGSDFRLQYTDGSTYGQLHITGIPQTAITGTVNKDYRADSNHSDALSTLGRQQVALPFVGYTLGDVKGVLGSWLNTTNTALNYTGRFNVASLFRWNNARARYDQISGSDAVLMGKPTDYFILPRRSQDAGGTNFTIQWDAAADLKTFAGTPSSDEAANTTVSLTGAAAGINFGINGNAKNYYYERYNSYILDPFRAGGPSPAVWDADYGKNLYQFGNPFLTNLDLTYIGHDETVPAGENHDGINIQGLVGIAVLGANSVNWQNGVGTTNTLSNVHQATTSAGVFQAGNVDALLIKPLTPFYVKMDGSATAATSLSLNNTRLFSNTQRSANTGYHVTSNRNAGIPSDKIVKQVAVVLKDASGNEMGRTHYAVSPSAVTGAASTELQSYVINYPIYTKEEIAGGGADPDKVNYKLYINAANETDYASKEIPLVINAQNAASVSFELYEAGQRLEDGQSFNNGKSFYIKKDNVITEIKDGDALAYGLGDYGLYYEAPEGFLGAGTSVKSSTVIARKANVWVVRFADTWKSADVEVYSAAGQLVSAKKNVSTASDYIIPLRSDANGMFLVKAVSSNGEVVIKKIVK